MSDKIKLEIEIKKELFYFIEKWNKKYGINLSRFVENRLNDWMIKEKKIKYSSEKDRRESEYQTAMSENDLGDLIKVK